MWRKHVARVPRNIASVLRAVGRRVSPHTCHGPYRARRFIAVSSCITQDAGHFALRNAKALSTYLGHSSIQITLDRYGHLMPGNEQEAARLLDRYLRTGEHLG